MSISLSSGSRASVSSFASSTISSTNFTLWIIYLLILKSSNTWRVFFVRYSLYRVSQEERSIFWEVIVSVILSKTFYMNMCPIPNGFRDRTIWMYNRKIVDKKHILRVRTVSNAGIYCSSNRVGTVYNKCSKIPPSTSMHFATRVKTWCVVRLSASWRSFMQAITSSIWNKKPTRCTVNHASNIQYVNKQFVSRIPVYNYSIPGFISLLI